MKPAWWPDDIPFKPISGGKGLFKSSTTVSNPPPEPNPVPNVTEVDPEAFFLPEQLALMEEAIQNSQFMREWSQRGNETIAEWAPRMAQGYASWTDVQPDEEKYVQDVTRMYSPAAFWLMQGNKGLLEPSKDLAAGRGLLGPGRLQEMEDRLAAPVESSWALNELRNEFNESIMPGISDAAIRAGAVGGSGEQDLTTRAAGRYAQDAASRLTQLEGDRAQAVAGLAGARGGLAQVLAGYSDAEVRRAQGATSAIDQILEMGLRGSRAHADLAGKRREFGQQRNLVPFGMMNQAVGALRFPGIGPVQNPIVGGTTTQWGSYSPGQTITNNPSTWSQIMQIMQMMNQAASVGGMIAMSTAKVKKDIQPLDMDEYANALAKLRETPVVKYKYRWENDDDEPHTGPIIELSPKEIRRGDYLYIPDYVGLTHAGVKALDKRVSALEEVLNG